MEKEGKQVLGPPMAVAARILQFGHYDQLIRELRMKDSTNLFNYMILEPHLLDGI